MPRNWLIAWASNPTKCYTSFMKEDIKDIFIATALLVLFILATAALIHFNKDSNLSRVQILPDNRPIHLDHPNDKDNYYLNCQQCRTIKRNSASNRCLQ